MNTQLFIDNEDIATRFGISLGAGAFDELLAFPPLKEPEKNNWPDEEGIEVDLETPCLQKKEISLSFLRQGAEGADEAFVAFLGRPGYRTFRIPALQKEWRLRLLSQSALNLKGADGAAFTLKLADDFPYRPAPGGVAGGGLPLPVSDFTLDGVSLDRYGVAVESGRDECLQSASVKPGLSRQFAGSDGIWYDTGQVVFDSKEVHFRCCLAAASMERFWACYDAFFHAWLQPGERLLSYRPGGKTYPCYYKQTSGFRLVSPEAPVVAAFNLTLVCTALQGKGDTAYLLAAEDGALVSTEDDYLIDLTPRSFMPTLVSASPASSASLVSPVPHASALHAPVAPRSAETVVPTFAGAAPLPPVGTTGEADAIGPLHVRKATGQTIATEETEETGDVIAAVTAGDTEYRTRKISEMPEVSFTADLFIPAVQQATGRNVRLAADLLTSSGESGGGGGGATTLGGLKNVSRLADSAPDGSILVKKEGIYQPEEGVVSQVEALMTKVFPFTLAFEGGGTFEKGSAPDITLRWEYDRAITTQTLNGETLLPSLRTCTFEKVSADTVYTLAATAGNLSVGQTVQVIFRQKKYWGTFASAQLTDAQIQAFETAWATRRQAATCFDCTGGKYPYYILPASLAGGIEFWVGGLRNTDWHEEVRTLTNASGYTEPYAIFRLNSIQTGVLNIEIK